MPSGEAAPHTVLGRGVLWIICKSTFVTNRMPNVFSPQLSGAPCKLAEITTQRRLQLVLRRLQRAERIERVLRRLERVERIQRVLRRPGRAISAGSTVS